MITIIIADDHTVFRQGMKLLLSSDERFQLIGEAKNGREALELIRELSPEVAVLDFSMPRPDGIEVITQALALRSSTRCIILSMKDDLQTVRRSLDAGARGYLLKEAAFAEIADAIVRVAAGKIYLGAFQESLDISTPKTGCKLTNREEEILRQVALGLTSRQIADNICLSHRTVETHRFNIMEKLDIHTSAGLTLYAREKGLV